MAIKVLVTGRHGQLARSLAEQARWRSLSMFFVGKSDLDLEIAGSAAQAVRSSAPDVIINTAAYTAVDQAEDEPERAFRINAEAVGELATAARDVGARLIHVSTDYVFDGRSPEPYREDAPAAPLGVYGRSKLAGEKAVREALADHIIVRTAWVYSPFGRNFVKTMLSTARGRDELSVVADQRGNPTSALDLADALIHILDHWTGDDDMGLGRTYHVAGSGEASWFDLAQQVFADAARLGLPSAIVNPIRTADWPTRAERPPYSLLDSSRFAADFGHRLPDWRTSTTAVVERLAAGGDAI